MSKLNAMGKRIREIRKKKGLSREQLAEMVNITPYYLGEIEREIKCPGLPVFVRICNTLDVSAEYLLRGKERTGGVTVAKEIEERLEKLTRKQKMAIEALLDTYMKHR